MIASQQTARFSIYLRSAAYATAFAIVVGVSPDSIRTTHRYTGLVAIPDDLLSADSAHVAAKAPPDVPSREQRKAALSTKPGRVLYSPDHKPAPAVAPDPKSAVHATCKQELAVETTAKGAKAGRIS